jgi:hypothetical protein
MSSFPLYTQLRKDLPKKDLSAKQKGEYISGFQELDEKGSELVYALIRAHQFFEQCEGRSPEGIPYQGTSNRQDVTFDLEDLPIPLKHILSKFVVVHIRSMKEDVDLASARTS